MPTIKRHVKASESAVPVGADASLLQPPAAGTAVVSIPDVSGLSAVDAALAYAAAGLFVGPVKVGTKNPGVLLGAKWNEKTSTIPDVIRGWYADHPTAGVFIHTGPSGLVVFDLDKTETLDDLPSELAAALRVGAFQRSRGTGDRGHYVFTTDERLSNSAGAFSAWGDVRADNGVIVAAPSVHPGTGAPYLWVDAGPVPPLPAALRALLRSGGPDARPALKPSEQTAFFDKFIAAAQPEALQGPLTNFSTRVASGESRHMALATVLPWALREARQGLYSARAVFDKFGAAFLSSFETAAEGSRRGPAPGEFENTFSWAAAQPTSAETAESLWELSPQLARIRRHALKQMVTPWSLLGVGILRSLAAVPPSHVLPDIVGTTAPPNLFVGLVGASGAGKGSAEGVARDLFQWSESARTDVRPGQPGSGEGIPKMFGSYQAKPGGVVFEHTRVLMSVSEIDSLAALFKRDSSTLSSTLRALWSGETLGNDYSAKDNRVIVRAKRYRAGLLVGIQPDHAQPLFDDTTGGLLQRFVFVGTQDPSQPAPPEVAGEADAIRLPEWRGEDLASWLTVMGREVEEGESVPLSVPAQVYSEVQAARLRQVRGESDGIDGHRLLLKEKVALGFAVLHGHTHGFNMEHWEWAELLMLHSDTLRDEIQAALATVREGESRSRAQREGRAAAHREEAQEATLRDRARAKLLELLDRAEDDGWIAGAKLRQRLSKAQREVSDDVIAQLVEQEAIQAEEAGTDNNRGYRYRLPTKVPTD